ncbi:MAG: response regulator [Planctomycetota bacterium]|nr:MAG: response regulator [Planctomycetota bacterium]
MNDKVMFVDDEERLLGAIERRFRGELNLTTALGGPDALQKMKTHGPFAVIVTDMRMPGMDGLQFIGEARKIAGNTVFVMLTGNQDLTTAVEAVNRGQVFRFLTKPCPADHLLEAIRAGIKQYDLMVGRQELLHQTFAGSVKLLCEVLELAQPEQLGRTQEVQRILEAVVARLDLTRHWEFKVAARLANVGCVVVAGSFADGDELVQEQAAAAARLVAHIPRLESVAEIIRQYPISTGEFPRVDGDKEALVQCGATLLRVANEMHACHLLQMSPSAALARIRNRMPDLPEDVAQTVKEILASMLDDAEKARVIEVSVHDLAEGMILAEHLVRSDGIRILSRGTALSRMFIDRITRLAAQGKLKNSARIVEYPKRTTAPFVPVPTSCGHGQCATNGGQ